ncbi:hypothetical protein HAX54_044780 [Datura stramonium]|uniref:Uncharacterized protein n=1 Tax=Datura stramonium TaxID=4076 RepID=A0ABS8SPV3_DATST|nr:hypothetical protein [Datura stramonium]
MNYIHPRGRVHFVIGAPLGFYRAWPVFALTHHLVISFVEAEVYPGVHFTRYTILIDIEKYRKGNWNNILDQNGLAKLVNGSLRASQNYEKGARIFVKNSPLRIHGIFVLVTRSDSLLSCNASTRVFAVGLSEVMRAKAKVPCYAP